MIHADAAGRWDWRDILGLNDAVPAPIVSSAKDDPSVWVVLDAIRRACVIRNRADRLPTPSAGALYPFELLFVARESGVCYVISPHITGTRRLE